MERVILVDERDREVGSAEKLEAHAEGKLHRAFSIFVFNPDGHLLLQQRASAKYHSGSLWSNTCCGHPRPGESICAAARRRLREEMNFNCELHEAFEFVYRAEFENNLIEHEYDHVLVGEFSGVPAPNAAEVEAWTWVALDELKKSIRERPEEYTYWLRVALNTADWLRAEKA